MTNRWVPVFVLLLATVGSIRAQPHRALHPRPSLLKLADSCLRQADLDYRQLRRQVPPDRFPETFSKQGMVTTGSSGSWMSGFYPGTLLYLYTATKDTVLYHEALRKLQVLEKEKNNHHTHDLGFMMYCSFGNAWHIDRDSAWRDIILASARSLAGRFSKTVGCTRSWDSGPSQFMVIIDNMMNLELLFAATQMTGDSSFYRIAVSHANTTMKNHFRPDYSSYHLVIYDPETGKVLKKQTVQGASDASSWARGQAWGLYGYTMTYRFTKDRKYLRQAEHIARYVIKHLPPDPVFYWDYQAPGIPDTWRDASATAITASALIELAGYAKRKAARRYLAAAEAILRRLSTPEYFSSPSESGGFIEKHGVGNAPKHSDVDVPLIYTDYYYIEALLRYRQLALSSKKD